MTYHVLGFYVSLKMKRAAVSLCASDVDSRKRGKSAKKGELSCGRGLIKHHQNKTCLVF